MKIENLGNKKEMKILELSANKIEVIENLPEMPKLEELYLNRNRFAKIENIAHLSHIRILGLSVPLSLV